MRKCDAPLRRWTRLSFLAAIASFVGYVALLLFVRANPRPKGDFEVTVRLQRNQNPVLARLMSWASWFGFRPQSLLLPLIAVLFCWLRGRRLASFFLTAAWASSLLSFFTKLAVKRPRPDDPQIRVAQADIRDSSFPSGHTLHYMTFWAFLSYLVAGSVRNPLARGAVATLSGTIIGLVGPSRVYLGHHWFTDVVASYLLGFSYFIGLITAYRWLRDVFQADGDVS